MAQLEDRMYRLLDQLNKTEPQQAQRMAQALKQARELLIRHDMDRAITLLQQGDLASAGEQQATVIKHLEQLLTTLTRDADQLEQIKTQMERLRELHQQIDALQQKQRDLKDRTAKDRAAADTQPTGTTQPAGEDALSPAQHALRREAGDLADKMAGKEAATQAASAPDGQESSTPPGQQDQQSGENQPDQPGADGQPSPSDQAAEPSAQTPGAQNVEQAGEHMQSAAEQIDAGQSQQATEEQQKAIDELEQAKRQLEEDLDQLRREQQEELLRGLEARFKAMWVRQKAVNESTAGLDAKGKDQWIRNDELLLAGNVQEETALAVEAQQALDILREDGTTVVFPQIVEQIHADMQSVAEQLKARDTGPRTQAVQQQIVSTLEELIAAVKQMRQDLQDGQSPSGGPTGQASLPLLPDSAELKLLRSCQLRVNKQTQEAEQSASQAGEDDSARQVAQQQLQRVADRQKELAEITRKMSERATGQ